MSEPDDIPVLATELLFHHVLPLPGRRAGARYFLLVGGRSGAHVTFSTSNLPCLSIQHGVQRLLYRANHHLAKLRD
jgi:hypothetical protein